jgi:hypothetical protein
LPFLNRRLSARPITISESNYDRREFVEFYNHTETAIDLSLYTIQARLISVEDEKTFVLETSASEKPSAAPETSCPSSRPKNPPASTRPR